MDTKICIICGEEKEISEYYKHPKMADGHLNKCKQCTKDGVKKRYYQLSNNPEWVESERSRHKEKYHQPSDYQANSPSVLTEGLFSFHYFFLLNFFFILSDFFSLTFLILTSPVRVFPLSSVINWSFLSPDPL